VQAEGKVAVVADAHNGIGFAAGYGLAAEGPRVFLVGRRGGELRTTGESNRFVPRLQRSHPT
jgi:NAD(P)-dependent dehydrogenase (short-subunit alcohol dehydrogenase family)